VNNLVSAGAAVAALISFFVSTKPAPSQTLPVIPLHTSYTYWDHHWIQWLPDHPRYEAIEASIASNSDGTSRYMRVWLTERQPPKNQTFFFDDETQTRSVFGKSFVRAIRYETPGGSGAPLGLDASFEDDEVRAVSWQLKFPQAERLSSQYAGLVPQGGHGEAGVQILWVLGPNATTFDSAVKIGAERFAVTPASVAAFGKSTARLTGSGSRASSSPMARLLLRRETAASPTAGAAVARFFPKPVIQRRFYPRHSDTKAQTRSSLPPIQAAHSCHIAIVTRQISQGSISRRRCPTSSMVTADNIPCRSTGSRRSSPASSAATRRD
jgi:hypothetical protein